MIAFSRDSNNSKRSKDPPMKWTAFLPRVLVVVIAVALLSAYRTTAEPTPIRIVISAKRFAFSPSVVTLKKGLPVVLVLKSEDVPHGIRFKEFGIDTKANKGKTSEVAFTPNQTGTFVGHCAVFCGAGHGTMILTLHVVD
jgi:cytochrome c oxidase subunit 2